MNNILLLIIKSIRTVYQRLTAGGTTGQQAVQSGIWVTGINVGDRILQLLKIVILARLLSPEAFGLLGIALLSVAAFRQFSELGFDQALVQHRDDNVDNYLNTAWIIKISRGILIGLVAFISAPVIADFFSEPQAMPLIQLVGLSPLILGLQNPGVVYFQKNLNFHKEFLYQISGRVVDLLVAIIFALIFESVWALAFGIISMNLVKLLMSYIIHDYRPSLEFDLACGKRMFSFGKWMFASSILVFLYGQGDDAFVGWFFAAASLGFYQIGYRFSNAPATEVTHVISRVAFPALSKVQDNVDSLRQGYFRAVHVSTVIAFPMASGIAAVAPQFIQVVLGNQWSPMIPLMQVLAVWGAFRAFGANIGPVFKSVGRPDIEVKIQALKVVIISLTIYPAAELFGVVGVAAAIIFSSIITLPIAIFQTLSIVDGSLWQLVRLPFYPLIGSLGMYSVVRSIDDYLLMSTGILQLFTLVVIGIITYFTLMVLIERVTSFEFTSLYRTVRQAL